MPALIFDFDGLIVETESVELMAWTRVLAEHGVPVEATDFLPFIGTHRPGLWDKTLREWLGAEADLAALSRRAREIRQPLALAAPVLAGVIALLDEASNTGWQVGLGSSSTRRWIEMHLDHRDLLQRFDAVVTREDVMRVKPDPDIYLEVASRLRAEPRHCVVLEDSEPGCRAAKAAGMACIAVPTDMTRASDFSMADRVVASLSEVTVSDLRGLTSGT